MVQAIGVLVAALMVVVPAGTTPVELVNDGRGDCPSYGGDPPA